MIKHKCDLAYYLEADRIALGMTRRRPRLFGDETWKFQRLLRKAEYLSNNSARLFFRPYALLIRFRFHRMSVKLGFTISTNCCGPGLQLPHRGTIVISDRAKIGSNCRIHAGVNIGAHKGHSPTIGNDVYVGPGAKIFGGIYVADGVRIGANAVVHKSVNRVGAVIVCPAATVIDNAEC